MAEDVELARVLENFDMKRVPHMGENELQDNRIACAFGDIPKAYDAARANGAHEATLSEPHEICMAVAEESARRGREGELVALMQGKQAAEEAQRIMSAAMNNQTQYENASGETKPLNCEMAFDAGYMSGVQNPSQPTPQPQITPAQIDAVTEACFSPDEEMHTVYGLIAGARQALRVFGGQDVSSLDVENVQPVSAPAQDEERLVQR